MILPECIWNQAPADLAVSHEEVHIWRTSLNQPALLVEQVAQTLSADERIRTERYHFARDRQHFIIARGLLRKILGNYLHVEPAHLQFSSGPNGKPVLAHPSKDLRFNLSHSRDLALFAFTRGREVGIDLEYIRPIAEAQQIAERYFSVKARNMLRGLSSGELQKQFFIYWTRMEAYLKARGDGLAGLSDDLELAHWFIYDMIPAPGYVAALAVQEHDLRIIYYEWEP